MKKIYLASNIGFSKTQKSQLAAFESVLEGLGYKVLEPFARNNTGGKAAKQLCDADIGDVKKCDAVFAIVNGEPPDVGVAVEVGYAAALGKKIFLYRDDFRNRSDSTGYPINLMFMVGNSTLYTDFTEMVRKNSDIAKFAKR